MKYHYGTHESLKELHVDPDRILLIYKGYHLIDEESLSSIELERNATIYFIIVA